MIAPISKADSISIAVNIGGGQINENNFAPTHSFRKRPVDQSKPCTRACTSTCGTRHREHHMSAKDSNPMHTTPTTSRAQCFLSSFITSSNVLSLHFLSR